MNIIYKKIFDKPYKYIYFQQISWTKKMPKIDPNLLDEYIKSLAKKCTKL